MSWWGWLSIGTLLMGAELFGVDAAFYLIFIGVSAIMVGLMGLLGLVLPVWAQWLAFAVIAVMAMVLFRAKLYRLTRVTTQEYRDTLLGEIVQVTEVTPAGGQSRVELRGSSWTAENVGTAPLAPGQKARVVETAGTLLKIRTADSTPTA